MFLSLSFLLIFAVSPPNDSRPLTALLHEIPASVPFHPEWEVSSKDRDLSAILSQPFTYLGEGHQCIAFQSQDERYVLKFPFQPSLPSSRWHPFPFLAAKHQRQFSRRSHKKLMKDSARYLTAFQEMKEETGLVYVHLNRSSSLNCKVQLKDKTGRLQTIDLNPVEFILQKKAQLIAPALERWMKEGKIEQAQQGITNLVQLFYTRFTKGLEDPEQFLEGNFGFLGTQAVQIDIGHLRKQRELQDKAVEKEKIRRLLDPLKQQLQSSYPELGLHLEAAFQKIWE